MNRMMGFAEPFTSSMTCFMRFSNSPFTPAPACMEADVEAEDLDVLQEHRGTSLLTMRSARPSTSAVLPTPASPTMMGLFFRRRARMSIIWRISRSRPKMGSISPARARPV
jgi:hypothetical protein